MTDLYQGRYHGRDTNTQSVPDNRTPYWQGRADQRRIDWPVGIACLIVAVIYIVFVEAK